LLEHFGDSPHSFVMAAPSAALAAYRLTQSEDGRHKDYVYEREAAPTRKTTNPHKKPNNQKNFKKIAPRRGGKTETS
jgi:hypothetical protein